MKTAAIVQGTHCPSCAALIKDVCGDFPAITSCSVDVATGHMEIEHGELLDLEALKKEIESLGKYIVTFENTIKDTTHGA